MELEINILSEICQIQKDKYHIFFSHTPNLDFFKDIKVKGAGRHCDCNPSYLGGEDWEIHSLRPTLAKCY
jgi:hypothetical protein